MIDYYDGVTEGAIREFRGGGSYYFKLIAWDNLQDKRLFVLKSVDDNIFNQLNANNLQNASKNELIDSRREELANSELLVLADKIDADSLAMFNVDETLKGKIVKALNKDGVDDLDDWMLLLSDRKEQ